MSHKQVGGSRGWLLPALLSLTALVAATVLWFQGAQGRATQPASAPPSTATPSTPSAPETPTPSTRRSTTASPRAVALPAAGVPRNLVIESLGIDAPVVPIAIQGTSLTPPADAQVLGWWSGGAIAGAAQGTALITGHSVNAGDGAMDDLKQIRVGAEIRVTTAQGSIRYVAESVQVLDKEAIVREASTLFSQEVVGRLVLVTSEGYDGTAYRSNAVVTAVPAT